MRYGLPYKGSKNKIAKQIIDTLPSADTFVDVFAGGCAITHAALLSGKYKRIIANDIDIKVPKLFKDAAEGRLPADYDKPVSKEDFERLKDSDVIVACCWSFGNNKRNYLWNDDTAGAKLLAHKMIVSDSKQERWRLYMAFIKYLQTKRAELKVRREKLESRKLSIADTKEKLRGMLRDALKKSGLTASAVDRHLGTNGMAGHYFGASQWGFPTREAYAKLREILPLPEIDFFAEDLERLERLERLESLQSLESLESLESLQSLESFENLETNQDFEVFGVDFKNLNIPENALVYCDPPYAGTTGYNGEDFDSNRFWEWARFLSKTHLVAVSEYNAPDDFVPILEIAKTCQFSATNNAKRTVERLFCSKANFQKLKQFLF